MATLSLSDYSGLKDTVAQYLNRRDLTDQIPAFIQQATAKLNRELRVRDMQKRSQASADGEYIAVPADFLAPYSLELATQPNCWGEPLEFVSEERAKELRAQRRNGPLRWYTIFGSEFELVPSQGSNVDFRLKYYAEIPPLVNNSDTNWLLTKSPDLYVVSACLEASLFLKDDSRLGTWASVRQQVIDAMTQESDKATKPQGALNATRRTFG